jgi:hypothetical protein
VWGCEVGEPHPERERISGSLVELHTEVDVVSEWEYVVE